MIGRAETAAFLAEKPVRLIWGVGHQTQASLEKAGIRTFSDLLRWDKQDLMARFGGMGERLYHLARGEDRRRVSSRTPVKSISNETTFGEDTADPDILDGHIWRLAENVADRAKAKSRAGALWTLKLKRANHRIPHASGEPDGGDADRRPHLSHGAGAVRSGGRRRPVSAGGCRHFTYRARR